MTRPGKLEPTKVQEWLRAHPPWREANSAIVAEFKFDDFAAALGFAVRVGCAAEKHDHHPDLEVGWGRVQVLWTTHDAGGITSLDLKLAEITLALASH